jgi:hypothetical protein
MSTSKKWSARVTRSSNSLDLSPHLFTLHNPKRIAGLLKNSALKSKRRKGTPYQSAMSMLNFYMNRAGKNLSKKEKDKLERSKNELRKIFHRPLK